MTDELNETWLREASPASSGATKFEQGVDGEGDQQLDLRGSTPPEDSGGMPQNLRLEHETLTPKSLADQAEERLAKIKEMDAQQEALLAEREEQRSRWQIQERGGHITQLVNDCRREIERLAGVLEEIGEEPPRLGQETAADDAPALSDGSKIDEWSDAQVFESVLGDQWGRPSAGYTDWTYCGRGQDQIWMNPPARRFLLERFRNTCFENQGVKGFFTKSNMIRFPD